MAKNRGYDPVEDAIVSEPRSGASAAPAETGAPPPPPPAAAAPSQETLEQLEEKRREIEGTPIHHPEKPSVQVPPPPASPPPAGKRFRVMRTRIVNFNGHMTTLAKGSIVGESTHDMRVLREHGIELEPA